MKSILPLVLFFSLAGGHLPAQETDPDAGQPTPAEEESTAGENMETATGESLGQQDPGDAGNQDPAETPEPLVEELVAETDEETAQPDIGETTEVPAISASDNEALAETTAVEEKPIEAEPAPPAPGMAVRVERVHGSYATASPGEVELRAPFPAKLLADIPDGWRIEKSERAPAFNREVKLSDGSIVTLTVQPHLLVPDADGNRVFAVDEPGYAPDLGYRQNATVGAILATSIRQLDDDSRQLGNAIDQLQQLLISLPRQEPAAQAPPQPGFE